jgi:malto-oligosyltrehalose trehalohydrolase
MTAASFGPRLNPQGGVTFRLWAPAASRVDLVLDDLHPMRAQPQGWFETTIREAGPGSRYRFRIDGDLVVPDPASRFQPEDVHGPSEVVAPHYAWRAPQWRGRPWTEAVILELHVGAFTPAGTFRAAIEKLDHLAGAGVTAIELMPVADFPGRWNWGYDGVLPFAPDHAYGRPEDLRALVDAAHERQLMVFLDVVYNHFGPEGNYLGRYAPEFFTAAHSTPWGKAIDYSVPEVRRFAIENALAWLRDYRFDGLRLDAVHALVEPGEPSVLVDLSRAVGGFTAETGRSIHLILENDDNRASLLEPFADPPRGKYRAQWNDDYHHAWHVLLTGEHTGYYRDYRRAPGEQLARILSSGFAYQGEASAHRDGARRGEPSAALPPAAFISFLQNHDQIGNRPLGERLSVLAPARAIEAALQILLLAPMPPLLFMGEEWGSTQPFPYFCDFGGKLADAVRRGRKAEFAAAYSGICEQAPPDPIAERTFRSAALDWSSLDRSPHKERLALVRRLLAARREHVTPQLEKLKRNDAHAEWRDGVIIAHWRFGDGSRLVLVANLGEHPRSRPPDVGHGRPIWGGAPPPELPPWSVFWSIE